MRYWWVNQNQTYRHEVQGGYLWSPKRNANGARNPFYESMREVAPGDLIFSFMDTRILAVGIAALGAISAAAEAADGCGRGWFYNGERCAQQEGHPGPRYYGPRERYYEPEAPRYYEPEAEPRYYEPQPETRYYEPEPPVAEPHVVAIG